LLRLPAGVDPSQRLYFNISQDSMLKAQAAFSSPLQEIACLNFIWLVACEQLFDQTVFVVAIDTISP